MAKIRVSAARDGSKVAAVLVRWLRVTLGGEVVERALEADEIDGKVLVSAPAEQWKEFDRAWRANPEADIAPPEPVEVRGLVVVQALGPLSREVLERLLWAEQRGELYPRTWAPDATPFIVRE